MTKTISTGQSIVIGVVVLIILVIIVIVAETLKDRFTFPLENESLRSEDFIRQEIAQANYCFTDDDCVDVGSKCPFGCNTYVNDLEANRIKKLIDSFDSKCNYNCIQCPNVTCRENRCYSVCR